MSTSDILQRGPDGHGPLPERLEPRPDGRTPEEVVAVLRTASTADMVRLLVDDMRGERSLDRRVVGQLMTPVLVRDAVMGGALDDQSHQVLEALSAMARVEGGDVAVNDRLNGAAAAALLFAGANKEVVDQYLERCEPTNTLAALTRMFREQTANETPARARAAKSMMRDKIEGVYHRTLGRHEQPPAPATPPYPATVQTPGGTSPGLS